MLSLTASGRTVVAKIEAELSKLRETVFESVSAADLKTSLRVFQTLLELTGQSDRGETIQAGPNRKESAR